jgi:predicted Zn-dependent peptidase
MAGTKTATVLVMVRTGSKYENKNNSGISHFLEHMFFKGTEKRPDALAISSELDGIGAEFNAFTGKEYTGYWVKAGADRIELAMDVVSDMLLNSKLNEKEIEREKGVIIEELNMYRDDPAMYIEDLFEELLYGNQPAGRDTIGTKENILKFKRRDFTDYLASQYGAQNTFVCVAGNLNKTDKSDYLAEKYFSKLKPSKFQDKKPAREKQSKPEIKLHYKKTDQAHLSLGARAFPIGHKDEHALKAAAILLGGSMSSRLFIELRERRGLAYSVKTQAEFYTDSGYLTTEAGVPIGKLSEAVKIILNEYKKLANQPVDKKELERTKNLIRGRAAIQLESSDNVASWYGKHMILRDKILTPEEFLKAMDKVSAEDIKRVARDIFINKGLNLAVIGPLREGEKFEKLLQFN